MIRMKVLSESLKVIEQSLRISSSHKGSLSVAFFFCFILLA